MRGNLEHIEYKKAVEFLMPRHYSGRKPQISKAFGWFCDGELKAVCTFGKPASSHLCWGICGKEHERQVYELNRLCRLEGWDEPLSQFVSLCLRELKKKNWIIVSYSDTGMSHNGYIYQACNFIYTGKTKERTVFFTEGNKHSRHHDKEKQGKYRKVRTSKHRYVYFCANSKRQKKEWLRALNYEIEPYPKGENKNYKLGTFQQPIIVVDKRKDVTLESIGK